MCQPECFAYSMYINDIHGHPGIRAEPVGKSCRQSEFFSVQRGAPVHQQLASIALARHDGPAAVLSR
jgi:hypothetical protein